jgi:hypothetical protein
LFRNVRDKNKKKKKIAVSFNHTNRYINVLSISNTDFYNPDELEIKDITESDISASYLDILLNIDSNGREGKLTIAKFF